MSSNSSPRDWQVTKRKVTEHGQHILKTGQWADCKFNVREEPHLEIVEAHKLILAMSSLVFEAMFFGEMAEKNDLIRVTDMKTETLEALLEYIYTDNVILESFHMACELCYSAKKYMFPLLIDECVEFILYNLSPESIPLNLSPEKACRGYEFAKLFEKPVLMEECLEIIHAEANTILKNPSFEEIQLETLIALFEQEKLQIYSEIELVSAAERWASSECLKTGLNSEDGESLRSVIGNTLTKIRFLTLTPQKFAAGRARSSLLKENEAFAILMNMLSNKREWPMPQGFSTIITPRKKRMVETGLDYHCCRTTIDKVDCQDSLVSLVTFTVDKDIRIIGVEVSTQVNIPEISPVENFSYIKKLSVELYDSDETRLFEEHFTPDVKTDSYVKLKFHNPIHIKKEKIYCIVVSFEEAGTYPLHPCKQRISCNDSVSSSFGVGNIGDGIFDELIRSIIFFRDEHHYY